MFSGIVSKASTLDVLSTGVAGNYNGALQVVMWNSMFTLINCFYDYTYYFFFFFCYLNPQMTAEFQVLSPLVPTRESYYVRYCKQHAEGTWAVVDVSLDTIRPSPTVRCRRRPSGCLIQEMPNGYSKVNYPFLDAL